MYINPILVGVLSTIGFELLTLFVMAVISNYNKRR